MKCRTFLKSTAAGVAASAMALDAKTYGQVQGANERIGIAFLGVGGRCQQHIDVILALQAANANSVRPVAVCDVWDGNAQLGRRPDGTFSYRFALPDGKYELPAVATSVDGTDSRSAELKFSRDTRYAGEVGQHPQDARLKAPLAANVA